MRAGGRARQYESRRKSKGNCKIKKRREEKSKCKSKCKSKRGVRLKVRVEAEKRRVLLGECICAVNCMQDLGSCFVQDNNR